MTGDSPYPQTGPIIVTTKSGGIGKLMQNFTYLPSKFFFSFPFLFFQVIKKKNKLVLCIEQKMIA